MAGRRVAVIGAGPIGLEFALAAAQRGMKVEVFEKAKSIAAHVQQYNFVQLFSPWRLNMTAAGVAALESVGAKAPADLEAFPTGGEYIDQYLEPLSRAVERAAKVHFGTEVAAVGRGALLKHESIGGGDLQMPSNKPLALDLRRDTAFDLLVRQGGEERFAEGFDFVIDCTGVYRSDQASWAGRGGMPALGESGLRAKNRLFGTVPDALGANRQRFAGRRAMLVGTGMSAATTARFISDLARDAPGTSLVWLTRSAGSPFSVKEDDVLPQRKALCQLGNQAAAGELAGVEYIGGGAVRSIKLTSGDRLEVTVQTAEGERTEVVDEFVSNCGFKPDTSIFQELQVHQCYASEGPMKLAATLLGGSGDCLAQVSAGVDSLTNPEPGFFVLGHKSYGRNSAFLLKIGHEQVAAVIDKLAPQGSL